jgi:hypothetical protein
MRQEQAISRQQQGLVAVGVEVAALAEKHPFFAAKGVDVGLTELVNHMLATGNQNVGAAFKDLYLDDLIEEKTAPKVAAATVQAGKTAALPPMAPVGGSRRAPAAVPVEDSKAFGRSLKEALFGGKK